MTIRELFFSGPPVTGSVRSASKTIWFNNIHAARIFGHCDSAYLCSKHENYRFFDHYVTRRGDLGNFGEIERKRTSTGCFNNGIQFDPGS